MAIQWCAETTSRLSIFTSTSWRTNWVIHREKRSPCSACELGRLTSLCNRGCLYVLLLHLPINGKIIFIAFFLALVPDNCSPQLRQFIAALFMTHTESRLNSIGRLTLDSPMPSPDYSDRTEWCAKLVRRSSSPDIVWLWHFLFRFSVHCRLYCPRFFRSTRTSDEK